MLGTETDYLPKSRQPERLRIKACLFFIQLSEIHQFIYQSKKLPRTSPRNFQLFPCLLVFRSLQCLLQRPLYQGNRRTEFMCHIGEESNFSAVTSSIRRAITSNCRFCTSSSCVRSETNSSNRTCLRRKRRTL